MELSSSNIKKFYIFTPQKKAFLMFQETEFFYISENGNLEKISGNGNPKKTFIFQEVTFRDKKIKKTRS